MITANRPPTIDTPCSACRGDKGAPCCVVVNLSACEVDFAVCEECARDLANAVGFFAIREGGWSKLEPRKRKGKKP